MPPEAPSTILLFAGPYRWVRSAQTLGVKNTHPSDVVPRGSRSIMHTEENKATAFRFFECFTASDIPGALDTMTDDATWWIPGKKERSPSRRPVLEGQDRSPIQSNGQRT